MLTGHNAYLSQANSNILLKSSLVNNNLYQTAYAGSRVDYDRPSLEAIGSGEGNQAHGWGLYYALNRDVAERYRETFIENNDISFRGKTYSSEKNQAEYDALQ